MIYAGTLSGDPVTDGNKVVKQFIDANEKTKTPICLPTNNPSNIPRGTGDNKELRLKPCKDTPALANANNGIIK